jgi:UDP-glucose 4-epimerase
MADRLALVTGATGAIGPAVVRELQGRGFTVRVLSREQPPEGVLPRGIEVVRGELADPHSLRAAAAGAAVVIHLAALLHQFGPPSAALNQRFQEVNVAGTRHLVQAAIAAGVERIVYLSTIAVYGQTRGAVVSENTPAQPDTPYGRTKLEAESFVTGARRDNASLGVVLRAAAVYGPRIKGNYRTLAAAVARGRYVPIGPGENRRTVVHDTDLARAITLAAQHPDACGCVFNVSDGRPHRLADIVGSMYRAIGRTPPRIHVPVALARTLASGGDLLTRITGLRVPMTGEALNKYLEDVAIDATRIQRVLGFAPAIDLDAGWRDTMAAIRRADSR